MSNTHKRTNKPSIDIARLNASTGVADVHEDPPSPPPIVWPAVIPSSIFSGPSPAVMGAIAGAMQAEVVGAVPHRAQLVAGDPELLQIAREYKQFRVGIPNRRGPREMFMKHSAQSRPTLTPDKLDEAVAHGYEHTQRSR